MSRKLGNKLKSIRLKRNLSQTEMANILGYSGKGMISRLENDSAEMSYDKLMILLSRFGDEFEGEEIVRKKVKGYTKMDTRYQAMLKVPYIQTSLLINELVNLDHKVNNGNIQIMEKSGMRKDRYSSLGYNYWVLQQIIRKKRPTNKNNDLAEILTKQIKVAKRTGRVFG